MTDKISNEVSDILNALRNELIPIFDENSEICVEMLIDEHHDRYFVLRVLNKKVKNNELTWRWALRDGKRIKAYRAVSKH